MNERIGVDTLGDMSKSPCELSGRIYDEINDGNIVVFGSDQVDSCAVIQAVIEEDGDLANKLLSSIKFNAYPRELAGLMDDKQLELAEEAARSYKGKYL